MTTSMNPGSSFGGEPLTGCGILGALQEKQGEVRDIEPVCSG